MSRRGGRRGSRRSSGGFQLGPAFRVNLGTSHPNQGMEYVYIFFFVMGVLLLAAVLAEANKNASLNAHKQLDVIDDGWVSFSNCLAGWTNKGSTGAGNVSMEKLSFVNEDGIDKYEFMVRANGYTPFTLEVYYQNNLFPTMDGVYVWIRTDEPEFTVLDNREWLNPEWQNTHLAFTTTSGETGVIFFGQNGLLYGVTENAEESCSN